MAADNTDEEIGDRPGLPRPRETATLVGHGSAEAAFGEGIADGRLHHAWLIGGPAGIGKATLAYRVARRLLGYPQGDGPPGLAIPADHPVHGQVAGLSHPNLVALRRHRAPGVKTLPTKISVDMVRKALDLFASTAADSGWRVCILDSAEDLNANAANALLKVLEEGPAYAAFLLSAAQPGLLLDTVRSRCEPLCLPPEEAPPDPELVERGAALAALLLEGDELACAQALVELELQKPKGEQLSALLGEAENQASRRLAQDPRRGARVLRALKACRENAVYRPSAGHTLGWLLAELFQS